MTDPSVREVCLRCDPTDFEPETFSIEQAVEQKATLRVQRRWRKHLLTLQDLEFRIPKSASTHFLVTLSTFMHAGMYSCFTSRDRSSRYSD